MTVRVLQLMRRPSPGVYSMERLYEDVRGQLPEDFSVKVHISRFYSQGIWRRVLNGLAVVRQRADVYHVTGDVHFLTYFLPQRRTILTIHDCVSLHRLKSFKFWLFWLFWYWFPEKRCAVITTVSEATRQQVLGYLHCDPDKVRVIYNNVSEEFKPDLRPLCSDRPSILHVGTSANKNLDRHIASLEGLNCQLIIIGRLSDAQRKVLAETGIRYANHVDLSREALVEQYQQCDLLLFASTYEGFGLPIVEAQAVGRPVITSNLWSMPEVAGDAACLVDPFNIESIRAGVQRVITGSSYRETLIYHGFENVKRFRTEKIAAQYAALYREVFRQRCDMTEDTIAPGR